MHHVVSLCQHIQEHGRRRDWSDYNRRSGELLQSFTLISTSVSSSTSLAFLEIMRKKPTHAKQPHISGLSAVSSVLFHYCFPFSCIPPFHLNLTCGLIAAAVLVLPFATRVVDKIDCTHLGMHDDFCNIFPSMQKKKLDTHVYQHAIPLS